MSASDEFAAGNEQPIVAGLASVLNALGLHGAPLFSLAPRPTILMGAAILAAIAGKSFRVDLPTRSRIRTNPHLILSGTERKGATKLVQILLAPIHDVMNQLIDAFGQRVPSRRLLEREFAHYRDGITLLEQMRDRLTRPISQGAQVPDIDKELRAEANRLGLRYHQIDRLGQHVAGLRLLLHQMVVTPGLEPSDLTAWEVASIDGHVLELITEFGMAEKLLGLHPRHLARLAEFRRGSCNEEGIFARHGKIGNLPRLSTLWIADPSEVFALHHNPRLRQHRVVDPFIIADLEPATASELATATYSESSVASFVSPWRLLTTRLLSLRLHEGKIQFTPDEDALDRLANWTCPGHHEDDWFVNTIGFPHLVMVAAVNSCAKIDKFAHHTKATITLSDVEAAIALVDPVIDGSIALRPKEPCHRPAGPIPRSLEEVLAKLSAKGPLSKRELMRSFHQIAAGELTLLLQDGIARGIIIVVAGKYTLADLEADSSSP